MKKILFKPGMPYLRIPPKILMVMKLIIVIMTTCLLQVSAASFGQKITIVRDNIALTEIFKEIRKQTGYNVLWQPDKINTSVKLNLKVEDEDLDKVLDLVLKNQNLTYSIADKTVRIKYEEPTFLARLANRWAAIDVRGRVVDQEGKPLPGATVKIKSTGKSVSTNAKGEFYIEKVDEGEVLLVSFIGYGSREVNAAKEIGNVVLELSDSKLDELQVIAYGTTTRRLSTGNITSIKAEEIAKQSIDNPLYALQGRVPGLIVTPTTGMPGGAVNVQIRGRNSIGNVNSGKIGGVADPLIVVDGLPIPNNIPGLDGSTLGLNSISSMSFINPHDIESIEVLKDADATAIYGSRGANGVILITTKKGDISDARVTINIQNGWARIPRYIDVMNTEEYLKFRKQAYANANLDLNAQTIRVLTADVKYWDQTKYTDWQKVLLGNTAGYNDVQGTVTGGDTDVQYVIGGTYHRQTTIFPGDNSDKRGSAHGSLTGTSKNKKFKSILTTNYLYNSSNYPGFDFTSQALSLPPNAPDLYTKDGLINWEPLPSGSSSWANPIALIERPFESSIKNLISSGEVSYRPIASLNIKTQFGYNSLNGKSFRKTFPRAAAPPESGNSPISSTFSENEMENISIEPQIDYSTKIGEGQLNVLIGGSWQYTSFTDQSINASGFDNDATMKNLSASTTNRLTNSETQYKYVAGFARINYNLKNRYILNLNARRDGSSRFGPGNRFGNFGSVGLAWIMSDEAFFRPLQQIISFAKIRTSYGTTGNDGIGDYGYFERYRPLYADIPYQGIRAYTTLGLYNPYYGWEVTKKFEVGLETGFLKNRILFNPNVYINRSNNQLLSYPFPSISGPGSPLYNLPATISNYGFEFTLQSENLRKNNFSWSTSLIFSLNRNKLVSYPGLEKSPYYGVLEVGQPFDGVARMYKYAGVDPEKGQYQFYDANGKITLNPQDAERLDGGAYLRIMTSPKYHGGISNAFTYRRFDLSFFVQFTKQMGRNPLIDYVANAGYLGNLPAEFVNSWSKTAENSLFQKAVPVIEPNLRNAASLLYNSDFFYVDASFIRLKNLQFSYSIPLKKAVYGGNKSLKLFVQGQNLLTITNYKGFDPETQSMSSIPPLRTILIGISGTL